jgi:hypothetical protein
VKPEANSTPPGGDTRTLKIGKSVVYNERIDTSASGVVQVLLLDGSTFTVGPGSSLVIDKFVYNPASGKGSLVATFSKGALRFVGGKLSKQEHGIAVKTPAGAITVRGAIFQAWIVSVLRARRRRVHTEPNRDAARHQWSGPAGDTRNDRCRYELHPRQGLRTEDAIRQQDHRRERATLALLLWRSANRPLSRPALHQGALLQRSRRRHCQGGAEGSAGDHANASGPAASSGATRAATSASAATPASAAAPQ